MALPAATGPAHGYLGASPACWARYGELLAREYGDPAYMAAHRLTVDAYCAQHPGEPERRTIQSAHVHLVGLHLTLERDWPGKRVRATLAAVTRDPTLA
ncbi:DUF5946 family protein, partial [Sphingomonas bacterium]|uniref:DUF5946 family protein n=1 Tax=Sphingomonas bacterium TaxID=1895847 RepID=UPI001C2DAED0